MYSVNAETVYPKLIILVVIKNIVNKGTQEDIGLNVDSKRLPNKRLSSFILLSN